MSVNWAMVREANARVFAKGRGPQNAISILRKGYGTRTVTGAVVSGWGVVASSIAGWIGSQYAPLRALAEGTRTSQEFILLMRPQYDAQHNPVIRPTDLIIEGPFTLDSKGQYTATGAVYVVQSIELWPEYWHVRLLASMGRSSP